MTTRHDHKRLTLFISMLAALMMMGCLAGAVTDTPPATDTPAAAGVTISPTPPAAPVTSGDLGWVTAYFTDPAHADESDQDLSHYITAAVLPVIAAAKQSVDVTSLDLNLPGFVDALAAAVQRGVKVRVVYDGTNGTQVLKAADTASGADFDAVAAFQQAHIPAVDGGRSNGLMHDKIIVVDGRTLILGSWNMSYNDTFRNNNNLLVITDPTLIANYQAKFTELFVDKHFGTKARVGAQTSTLTISGTRVENYFSPVDHVMDKIVAQVAAAKKSIKFMAFTYTDKRLSAAMIAQAQAGLEVQGVIENRGASQGALVPLVCARLPVEVDGNKYTMHHKVIILDEATVITGSFNFTATADHDNDENVVIIHSPALAAQYLQEFGRVYGAGKASDRSKLNCAGQ